MLFTNHLTIFSASFLLATTPLLEDYRPSDGSQGLRKCPPVDEDNDCIECVRDHDCCDGLRDCFDQEVCKCALACAVLAGDNAIECFGEVCGINGELDLSLALTPLANTCNLSPCSARCPGTHVFD
ncbi:hypothetical protein [Nannocystis radixulma]|uniref:Uncharacterized protein n=1 Tax=Nannocystis radixulma TaxID=2995305 RepID=A0ABT5B3L6_9BACT|nr:hypothetical protein [Nannocystis radixulma]MDC0667732.1 hypothetical protein [Nannocystis radixulma]